MSKYLVKATITTELEYEVIADSPQEARNRLEQFAGETWDVIEEDMSERGAGDVSFEVLDEREQAEYSFPMDGDYRSDDIRCHS